MRRARLYWHIFVTDKTPTIVAEQLRYLERQSFPVTALVWRTNEYDSLCEMIVDILSKSTVIDLVTAGIANDFEFDTLKILYQEAANYDFVGYFHTKGATIESSNTNMWRNLMNFYTIQMAEATLQYMENENIEFAGVFGSNGLEGQRPFIAGNFWWARSSYVLQLPKPALLSHHTRYDCELWIGLGSGKMGTFLALKILNQPVTVIAEKHDTDKKIHGYMPFYEMYLAPFRETSGKLLEIGVYQGASLKLWQEILPHFLIEGADIEEKPGFPVTVHVGDQADRNFLCSLPDYTIVIDDGGHRSKQQIISLVSKIQNTCLYVIEDLHTSEQDLYLSYHADGEITCLEYLKQYPQLKPDYISSNEHERLAGKKIYIEQGTVSPIAFIL